MRVCKRIRGRVYILKMSFRWRPIGTGKRNRIGNKTEDARYEASLRDFLKAPSTTYRVRLAMERRVR